MDQRLVGRRLHIAGSASRKTTVELICDAHRLVRRLVRLAVQDGATLVAQAGPEPRYVEGDLSSPALVFDWTIIQEAWACLEEGLASAAVNGEPLLFAASSEKADADIPQARRSLWHAVLDSTAVNLRLIRPGSRSAGFIRELQAREGNLLVILGGGAGVEHLAELYLARKRPAVPLDIRLGASRDDGTVGGAGLNALALANTGRFFRLQQQGTEGARLRTLSMRHGVPDAAQVADRILALLRDLTPPTVFFVRLVNRSHDDFPSVESFFRCVVEPVAREAGYQRHEVGTDRASRAFMNVEIFEELHVSPLAIVDLTGMRPNCCIELGYALRGDAKVLITARDGTGLPFDPAAIPCHFWRDDLPDAARRALFQEFWRTNIDRPPLVQPSVLF